MIRRGKFTHDFTCLPNSLLNDKNLSSDATACLVYLLSKPEDWIISAADIQRRFGWGREKTQKTIKDLLDATYLVRQTQRKNGRFEGYDYTANSVPQNPSPETENPSAVGSPETEKPATVNQAPTKKGETQRLSPSSILSDGALVQGDSLFQDLLPAESGIQAREAKKRKSEVDEKILADLFERFWKVYPNKVGRKPCEKIFRKLITGRSVTMLELMEGLARYIRTKPVDRAWLNPQTFLNNERWKDELAPPNSNARRNIDYVMGKSG